MEVRLNRLFMRVLLQKKAQKELMNQILDQLPMAEVAKLCDLSERTIRDWRRGKFTIQLKALQVLCKETKIPFPLNAEIKDDYWYGLKGASNGGKAVFKKYGGIGDPEYRKKRWYEWWEREGQYKSSIISAVKPIKKPKSSDELAEFVGIVLGDGGITRTQVSFTFHSEDDKDYAKFVVSLTKKLFNVYVGEFFVKECKAVRYSISRTQLVKFCIEELGLKQGNKVKQQVDIPDWIKNDKNYSIACVRGLVDTDGCIFTHKYKVKNKFYSYKKFVFVSHSMPMRSSVFNILKENGLHPRFARIGDVRLDRIEDMKRYFDVFGSHNPKHLKRYKN